MWTAKHLITVPISACSVYVTFVVVIKLICFLSTPTAIASSYVWLLHLLDDHARIESALPALSVDLILAVVFVLQHSLMRTALVSALWRRIGLETLDRSLYNLTSALTLNFVIVNWRTVPTFILWDVDVRDSPPLWWTFVGLHTLAWAIILGGTILMDLPELLGVKQVYYDVKHLLPPMLYKSDELKRLYGHVRHPSFVGLSVVLWSANTMCADRLVLAAVWTLYMYVAWNTDEDDVSYHRCQLVRKRSELAGEQRSTQRSSGVDCQ